MSRRERMSVFIKRFNEYYKISQPSLKINVKRKKGTITVVKKYLQEMRYVR